MIHIGFFFFSIHGRMTAKRKCWEKTLLSLQRSNVTKRKSHHKWMAELYHIHKYRIIHDFLERNPSLFSSRQKLLYSPFYCKAYMTTKLLSNQLKINCKHSFLLKGLDRLDKSHHFLFRTLFDQEEPMIKNRGEEYARAIQKHFQSIFYPKFVHKVKIRSIASFSVSDTFLMQKNQLSRMNESC